MKHTALSEQIEELEKSCPGVCATYIKKLKLERLMLKDRITRLRRQEEQDRAA